MKFTGFKVGKLYKRKEDGLFFKKENDSYYTCTDGIWIKTDDLKLADEFEITQENPGLDTFSYMYNLYKTGDAETQKRYHDKLLSEMAKYLDEIRRK